MLVLWYFNMNQVLKINLSDMDNIKDDTYFVVP